MKPMLAGAALILGVALGVSMTEASWHPVSASFDGIAALHAGGPPLGMTGGFGEATCHGCHNELPLNGDGELRIEGLPEQYVPGETYLITLIVTGEGMLKAGFEAAFRFESTPPPGRQAGSLTALDERTKVAWLGLTPVYYVYQTTAGSPVTGDLASWTFEWTAPESGGAVSVHVAANSANGDDSPLGDFILTTQETVLPPER